MVGEVDIEKHKQRLREFDGLGLFETVLIFLKKRVLYKNIEKRQIKKVKYLDISILNYSLYLNIPYLKILG